MAQALVIEEESGISRGFVHPHNGYYAGDFFTKIPTPPLTSSGLLLATTETLPCACR
jgi:hypothetical protein